MASAFPPGTPLDGTVLNWCGEPNQHFGLYSRAYHKAAKLLIQNQDLDVGPHSDFESLPVVFLYRHALELRIKSILQDAGRLQGLFLRSHDLRVMLEDLRGILVGDDSEAESEFARIETHINQLCGRDPNAYAFRYPIDTRGGASLRDHFTFRVTEFAEQMSDLLNTLEGWQCAIDERSSADPGSYGEGLDSWD